jgi:hypothetical protein
MKVMTKYMTWTKEGCRDCTLHATIKNMLDSAFGQDHGSRYLTPT